MEPAQPLSVLTAVQQPFEAEHLQQVLESAGIPAYVDGLHNSTNFTLNTALGAITIRVADRDLARAEQVLEEARQPRGADWYCGHCAEFVDAGFDICWKCGQARSEVETQPPHEASPYKEEPDLAEVSSYHRVSELLNPYATPQTPCPGPKTTSPAAPDSPAALELEETIEKAWKLSVIGLVLLPFLAHIYSTIMLLGSLSVHAPMTARSKSRFFVAMLINLAALVVLATWLTMLLRRS